VTDATEMTTAGDHTLYANWTAIPVSNTGGNGNAPGPEGSEPAPAGVDVLVNGKVESAGTARTEQIDDRAVTTIVVDEEKLLQRLEAEGGEAVITIPYAGDADSVVGELNARMVKSMEAAQAVLEIRTDKATYTLPAEQINVDAISAQIGEDVDLQDIKIRIEIAEPSEETAQIVESAAAEGGLAIVVPPIEFTVTGVCNDTRIEVTRFNAYVERTVAIPEGVDPSRITTGIVVEPDGTVRHVPTKVILIDGRYYAQINSLTNSVYTVVWNPVEFADVARHWAKDAVNDMGSRLVVKGKSDGLYDPDSAVTRAEFAAIVVRALGLKLESGKSPFKDVRENDWFAEYARTAHAYGMIKGD